MMRPLVTLNNMSWVIPYSDLTICTSATRSGRLHHLAAGVCDGARGLLTLNKRGDREHVISAGLWRMRLADENVRHQFVIPGTIAPLPRLQCDVRRQLEILQRLRQFRALQRLRLLRR